MPSADEIQQHLKGAWRMMTGRPDGLLMLDISADGFWSYFFAIPVALPALAMGWVVIANEAGVVEGSGYRLSLVLRLAFVHLGSWVLPIAGLAAVARPAGIADRFVHYVVASNWAAALLVWIMLPPQLLRLLWPEAREFADLVSLLLLLVTLVLLWRLTNVAINRGPAMATAIFCGMFAASLAVLAVLQALLGFDAA